MPPWLGPYADRLRQLAGGTKAPQSLLIHGPEGVGRRELALWHAASLLGTPPQAFLELLTRDPPASDDEPGVLERVHPDLVVLRPPADKNVVAIEAVRRMIEFLHLKSHQGGARVALLWPAEAMTTSAANSLLKTLEEPPEGATLVLVASALSRLPATILSRCQRMRIAIPPAAAARQWLEGQARDADWQALLDLAGGAPLRALASHRAGHAQIFERFAADLDRLARRDDSPVAIAGRWAREEHAVTLRWLQRRAARDLRESMLDAEKGRLQSGGKGPTIQQRLDRLRDIELLQRNGDKAVNFELQLAALLQRWNSRGGVTGEAR